MVRKGSKEHIIIHEAQANNLKKLSLRLSRDSLVVFTGVSGSGKSSLLFDTLYAEGRRRYVESLSTYARQFLGRIQRPAVGYIKGVSPAIALAQRSPSFHPHSTVGTTTEIYDYLKLLYARIGITRSPVSGKRVQKDTPADILRYVSGLPSGTKILITSPVSSDRMLRHGRNIFQVLMRQGYMRAWISDGVHRMDTLSKEAPLQQDRLLGLGDMSLVIDRTSAKCDEEDRRAQWLDSLQVAFREGDGTCILRIEDGKGGFSARSFSSRFEQDGLSFEAPSLHLFSFNNAHGACPTCRGYGNVLDIDPSLVIPDASLSLSKGAIAPWRGAMGAKWLAAMLDSAEGLPTEVPYGSLDEKQKEKVWKGGKNYKGISAFFDFLRSRLHKTHYRLLLYRYQRPMLCAACKGSRLRKEALYVYLDGSTIDRWLHIPLSILKEKVDSWSFSTGEEKEIARIPLSEIRRRLSYLLEVGLGYLTLSRITGTLSGGEFQRLSLARSLGSPLVGAMYLLDEPSVGLHPRDVSRLVGILQDLRKGGNPVFVVEHEELIIRAADEVVDIGPGAGRDGGHLVFQGGIGDLDKAKRSLTADYLVGRKQIRRPKGVRSATGTLHFSNISRHTLRNITCHLPLGVGTVVTGVSGSGKSTLVSEVMYATLLRHFQDTELVLKGESQPIDCAHLEGDIDALQGVEFVGQQSIGRSSRANPATYTKAYDTIRQLFSRTALAQQRGFVARHFSFNISGGRCEECEGDGEVVVEMQFMADVRFPCELCEGKRFKEEVLDVTYQGKNIFEVLAMTIDEAKDFFSSSKTLVSKLDVLSRVGLGYVCLGQPLSTLSGGEAQRLKLASFLSKSHEGRRKKTLFIFDEPSTGLHFDDIGKLLDSFYALLDKGHTLVVVEHNLELIKCMDHVIDMGPEGGNKGGNICYAGSTEGLAKKKNNHTAKALAWKLSQK